MPSITIYVRLLDEGTDVWRPTLATVCGDGVFRSLATPNYNPEDESWEFLPGERVRCEKRKLSGGECIVAVELAH